MPANILLIVVDQMTSEAVGALGHPTVKTPHLDELVHGGAVFGSTYCSSPLCAPSRASLMTGRLPRRDRVYDNGSELAASVPTFAHRLNLAGYTTVLAGKMHFVGPDQHHGFQERLTPDLSPASFMLTPDWTAGPVANPGTSVDRLRYPPVQPWSLQLAYDHEVLHRSKARLRKLAREDKPFLLCASFGHPHDPFIMPEEIWHRYDGVDIDEPRVGAAEFESLHLFDQWMQIHHEADRVPLTRDETVQARRAYYAALAYVDDVVGELLAEVRRLGLHDDTVVIFTSDHGEMLGEHGMWFKRSFREGSSRVPLIVSMPGAQQSRTEVPTSLMDVTATILDLGEATDGWAEPDGRSLVPYLQGREELVARPVFAEYLAEGTVEPLLMVRDGRYKYVEVRGQRPLLFDLLEDPDEVANLTGLPEHASAEARLRRMVLHDLDLDELHEDVVTDQQRRLVVASGTPTERAWTVPIADAVWSPYPPPEPAG